MPWEGELGGKERWVVLAECGRLGAGSAAFVTSIIIIIFSSV